MRMFNWFNWESNLQKRIIIGVAILATVTIMLAFRMLTAFIFDAFVIGLAWVCIHEVMKTKKVADRGVRDYYVYPYIAIAYLTFLLGIVVDNPFPFWLHFVLQLVLVLVLMLYVFLMAYTDKDVIKRCKLEKKAVGRESRRIVYEYLKLILYPTLLIFTLIPLNHMAFWATEVTVEGAEGITTGSVRLLGLFLLLLVMAISMFSDIFAYCTGRILKGKKLCPNISPNKTIAGAVGGLFGGILGSLLVVLIFSGNAQIQQLLTQTIGYAPAVLGVFAVIGLLGSVMTQLGDLYASWLKRRCEVKDFGKWLPGHGGFMDRLDGIIFNSAFIFIFSMFWLFV